MNRHTPIFFLAFAMLSACSSMNGLLDFASSPADEPVAAAAVADIPVAPAVAPGNEAWCQQVAASERARAQASGFDAATLDRMTLQGYQQCRNLSASK
jgi:hypothetical protein